MILIFNKVIANFKELFERYPKEIKKPYGKNEYASKIRHEYTKDLLNYISSLIPNGKDYRVKYAIGFGNWSHHPYIVIRNIHGASSGTRGLWISVGLYFDEQKISFGLFQGLLNPEFPKEKLSDVWDMLIDKSKTIDHPLVKENGLNTIMLPNIDKLTEKEFSTALKDIINLYEELIPYYNEIIENISNNRLPTIFTEILDEYPIESQKDFKDNDFAKKLRNDFTKELNEITQSLVGGNPNYEAKISPGMIGWAKNPWAGIKNYSCAKTFQKGLYLIYIFEADGSGVHLSLDQGNDNFNLSKREKIANTLINKIDFNIPKGFTTNDNKINPDTIMSKFYKKEELNSQILINDLKDMIDTYEKLIPVYHEIIKKESSVNIDKILNVEDRNIWRIAPGENEITSDVWELFKKYEYVAIGWFGEKENIKNYKDFKSIDEIKKQFGPRKMAPKMIWDFANEIEIGDIIVVNLGRSKVAGIGIITSDYIAPTDFDHKNDYELNHIRKVKWLITDSFKVKNNLFVRMTINQITPDKWNLILFYYAKNNEKFKKELLKYLFKSFEEYKNSEDGLIHKESYKNESEAMVRYYGDIKNRWEQGQAISDSVWKYMISPKSIFSPYGNSYSFFEKTYNLSEDQLYETANIFFETVNEIIENDADFELHQHILTDYVENDYSKGVKTGLLTPTLYFLDHDFYIINKKTIDSVKFLGNIIGQTIHINNELLDYVNNNIKLHKFIVDLSEYVPDLANFEIFDMFCHYLCTSNLGYYAKEKPLPLIGFESSIKPPEDQTKPLKLTPELLDLGNLKVKDGLLYRICGALNSGKHIIFDGAPGTGKTEIAGKISESAISNDFIDGYILTTATSDWTTFDTIGGFMPDADGKLYFYEGKFLEAIRENKWLIIDEINRADIDKAFGQLFTVLSGSDVDLPYKDKNGNSISIKISDDEKSYFDEDTGTYYIGKNWRILATMNIYDKDSLFDLSYAFMRRFTFINVGLPDNEVFEELIDEFAQNCIGDIDQDYLDKLKYLLTINKYRELGPAIFKDMINYIEARTSLDDTYDIMEEAILSYVIPQFEGLPPKTLKEINVFFDEKELNSEDIKAKLSEISGFDING